jgi:bleomycin hydrolase
MPKSAFPESFHSGNSRMLNWLLTNKLREFACTLRNAHSSGQSMETMHSVKDKMMEEVYRILSISLGEPPIKFDWSFRDKEKAFQSFRDQSPLEFYKEIVGFSLEDTVSLINDPRNEMNRLFTVEYLGNVVGGRPVTYVNVPIDQLKKYTIKSIKDHRPGIKRLILYLY